MKKLRRRSIEQHVRKAEHRREAKRSGHERRREESTGAENRTTRWQAGPDQVWAQAQSGHGRTGLPRAFLGGRRLVRTRARFILLGCSGKKASPLSAWRGEPSTLVDSWTSKVFGAGKKQALQITPESDEVTCKLASQKGLK